MLVPASEDAFANAVLALLADEARRCAMGEQAARAVQRYTISATAARMSAVYEEAVVAGPRTIEKESVLTRGLKLELKLAKEVWRGTGEHIRSLGESASTVFSTSSWKGEDFQRYWKDMRSGLKAMIY